MRYETKSTSNQRNEKLDLKIKNCSAMQYVINKSKKDNPQNGEDLIWKSNI